MEAKDSLDFIYQIAWNCRSVVVHSYMEASILYVVTSGQYSDFGINAIFSTRQLAEGYINSFNKECSDEMGINEYPLDPFKLDICKGRRAFHVCMDKNGDTYFVKLKDSDYDFTFNHADFPWHSEEKMDVHCFANDEQHAVKIANEKRIQSIANNSWGGCNWEIPSH